MSKFDEVLFYESEFKRLDKALLKLNQYKYKYNNFKRQKKTPSPRIVNYLTMIEEDTIKVIELKNLLKNNKYKEYEDRDKEFKFLDIDKIKQKYLTSSDVFRNYNKNKSGDSFDNIYYSAVKTNLSYILTIYDNIFNYFILFSLFLHRN